MDIADKNNTALRPVVKLSLENKENGDVFLSASDGETSVLLLWINLEGELWISSGVGDKLKKLGLPATANGQMLIGNRMTISLERRKE
jgi:hypothetical protein